MTDPTPSLSIAVTMRRLARLVADWDRIEEVLSADQLRELVAARLAIRRHDHYTLTSTGKRRFAQETQ